MVSLGWSRTVTNLSVVSALTVFLGACSSFSLPSLSILTKGLKDEPISTMSLKVTSAFEGADGNWVMSTAEGPVWRQTQSSGFSLTPADTERLLHDLSVRRPVHANAATALRTVAVAALVADTGRGVPELARLRLGALHLDGAAHVELGDESCPLGGATV